MGKSKMIAKSCPKCDMQVAVASKSCKCGHAFFSTRRSQDVSPSDEQRRRTSRVRRGKPQFYDSQDYQRQKRKTPKKRSMSHGSIEEEPNIGKTKESAAARARRRRALRRAATETVTPPAPPAPAPPPLRPPQLARCALILAEINRKMTAVVWSPDS